VPGAAPPPVPHEGRAPQALAAPPAGPAPHPGEPSNGQRGR
jgi:hypothetical protein